MNFLSLVGVELKKIRRSKILLILLIPVNYDVDSEHYQCGYELRPERNPDYAGKQLFHSGLYGYGLVYDPGVAGHLYGTAESNGTLQ